MFRLGIKLFALCIDARLTGDVSLCDSRKILFKEKFISYITYIRNYIIGMDVGSEEQRVPVPSLDIHTW